MLKAEATVESGLTSLSSPFSFLPVLSRFVSPLALPHLALLHNKHLSISFLLTQKVSSNTTIPLDLTFNLT